MSYRPSATPPRGTWGRFLDQMRRERGWSQQQAFEELREGLRLGPKSRASYVAIEHGRTPRPDEQDFLVRYFGKGPDAAPEPLEATETTDSLLAAVRLLLDEIRAERAERREWEQGFLEAMRELATAAAPRVAREPALPGGVRR